ncbi:MAG: AN1-type zinc finger domain-containing protein [Candidatus Thorarchaeota archaeon]
MTNCYFCKDTVDNIPYRCSFCGMVFCGKHRLPENHECSFDLREKSSIGDSIHPTQIIYQDALDFMDKDLSVAKIYEYVTTKEMNEKEATELLTYFLDVNDDFEIRINSIMAFKVLNLRNTDVFNTLESCILSEENAEVKKTALNVIKELFPKRSKEIQNWIKDRN